MFLMGFTRVTTAELAPEAPSTPRHSRSYSPPSQQAWPFPAWSQEAMTGLTEPPREGAPCEGTSNRPRCHSFP